MKVKQRLIELKEQKDRLTGVKERLETARKTLRDELEEINTRASNMDAERAARMAAFIDGNAGSYDPGDEAGYIGLMSVMSLRKKEVEPAIIKIEKDIKEVNEQIGLSQMAIDKVLSDAWLELLDEDLPQIKETFEKVFCLMDGMTVFLGTPNYGAKPSFHHIRCYLEERGYMPGTPNKHHLDCAHQRFFKKFGINPQI